MSALATTVGRRDTSSWSLTTDVGLIVGSSLLLAGLAQLEIRLPASPVPVTGQTLGVLLIGAALGSKRAVAAVTLYLAEGAAGLPFFAGGASGLAQLAWTGATAGYLYGFIAAAFAVGKLAERGRDRDVTSALGAMVTGEILVFAAGVSWLIVALGLPATKALELGLYPFVLGEVIKVLIAATTLPAAWRLAGRRP